MCQHGLVRPGPRVVADLDAGNADHDGKPPEPLLFFKGTLGGFGAVG